VSSSFSITEQSYGEIRISPENISYKKKSINVDEWAKSNGLIDDNLLNYQAYTKKLFVEDGQKMAYGQLIESGIYDESILDPIAYFVGEMNWRY
ncbi:MAG: metallophosphoesterase, partial [Vagococcus sp.]